MLEKVLPKVERKALKNALGLLEIDKLRFTWSVMFGAGAIGSGIGLGAVSAWLIARAAQLPPVLDLSVAATSVRAFGVGKAVFRYLERISSHWVALKGMSAIRTRLYAHLSQAPTNLTSSLKRGDILARTGNDVDTLGDVVIKSLLPLAVATVTATIGTLIVGFISPLIGLILGCCLLLSGLIGPYLAMRGARESEIAQIAQKTELNIWALTMLEHATELRVNGKLPALTTQATQIEDKIQQHRDRSALPRAIATVIEILALGISVVAALLIGTYQVAHGDLSAIGLVVCTLTPLAAFEATQRLPEAGVQLVRSARAALRIMDLLEVTPSTPATLNTNQEKSSLPTSYSNSASSAALLPDTKQNSAQLVVKDLSLAWPNHTPIAHDINLSLSIGKSIAIVGKSGIGKSTLLYTLAGLIPPQQGTVLVNGAPAHTIARSEISQTLTFTAEDAHIFGTTVLENLRVANGELTPEQAKILLTQVGLAKWLSELPEGLDTMIGTDARSISGGQRRRLLVARALASPAPILLLDEPGEHLDAHTADTLIRDLLQLSKLGRAILLVTHRLTPLDAADEVIILGTPNSSNIENQTAHHTSACTVVARGTHAELQEKVAEYSWSVAQEG